MPLLSFSGEPWEGPFWKQILEGRKTQTCRHPRKRPIKKGDKLRMYWKVRIPKEDKPIHFIGEAVCKNVERKKFKDFYKDDEFAKRDGFKDYTQLQFWFGYPYTTDLEDEFDVISWDSASLHADYGSKTQ